MKKFKIGLQLYSVRDEMEKDFFVQSKKLRKWDMTALNLPDFSAELPLK